MDKLEVRLPDYDVLLCHAGLKSHKYFIEEAPKKFPNLRTAIITDLMGDYSESDGRVAILNFNDPEAIVTWILNPESN